MKQIINFKQYFDNLRERARWTFCYPANVYKRGNTVIPAKRFDALYPVQLIAMAKENPDGTRVV